MEERRDPTDPDVIPMDDAPVAAPVVDAGTGTGAEAAEPENVDAIAASTSPEAPAAAGADPAADSAAASSVTDPVPAPDAVDGTPPPAAVDTPDGTDPDVAEPAVGSTDAPAADDLPPVEPAAEPTIDTPAETGTETPAATEPTVDEPAVTGGEPGEEPAASATGDVTPVPDVDPVAPVESVNTPAAEPSVTDAPAVDPAPEVAAAPAGEEQTAAVVDGAAEAAAATDSPVDAGLDPVAPADTQTDTLPAVDGSDIPAADPVTDPSLPDDITDSSDVPPVTGEAPVPPPSSDADLGGAPSGEGVADDLSGSTIPDTATEAPVDGTAAPVDTVADAPVEPVEPVDPVAEVAPEEMTSAWVDGVSVDAEDVKQKIEDAANGIADADNVTEELEDAAVALEELSAKISENLADENPVVSETTVNLTRIVAEKSLERIGEVMNLPVSMESAATPRERLMITLEAIDGKLGEIWEAVKRALTIAWDAVVKFFKTLFDSAYRVKAAIEKLREGLKALNGKDAPTGDKVEGGAANGVGFNGWSDVNGLKTRLNKLVGAMAPFLDNSKAAIHDVIVGAGNRMVEVCHSKETDKVRDEQLSVLFGELVMGYSKLGVQLAKAVAEGAKQEQDSNWNIKGVVETVSGELPGGYRLKATDFAAKDGFLTSEHLYNLGSGRYIRIDHEGYDAKEGPAAKEDDMLAILDTVETLIDAVIASKESVGKFEDDIARFRREAEQALKGADVDFMKEWQGASSYIRALANIAPSLVKQNSTLISLCVSIANNVVKYVTASARLYPSFGTKVVEGQTTATKDAAALPAPAAA
jgi:predicted  nucleic acid-binding Zn-ribbon protein